jgi:hypothetical protein
MDPYLEGYLWPDVHHRLATQISDQLNPHLRPRYVARIEVQVALDEAPEGEIGIMYPDVEIVRAGRRLAEPPLFSSGVGGVLVAEAPVVTPISVSVPLLHVEVPLATVEIRDTARNQLVTSIEILSPINKREPGLTKYREKRQRLRNAGVHLLEIDLLRRGQRPLTHPRVPLTGYLVALTRAGSHVADLWVIRLQDPLPIVSVPLRAPDDDIVLDLRTAFSTIYDRAAYDLSVDYAEPPPPPLSAAEEQWVRQLLNHTATKVD